MMKQVYPEFQNCKKLLLFGGTFDPIHNVYRKLGEITGKAFGEGKKIK